MARNADERQGLLSRESSTHRAASETPISLNGGNSHAHLGLDSATRDITIAEHELSFGDAVRQYPRAIFWSFFFSPGRADGWFRRSARDLPSTRFRHSNIALDTNMRADTSSQPHGKLRWAWYATFPALHFPMLI